MNTVSEAVLQERRLNALRYIEQCSTNHNSMPGRVPGTISDALERLSKRNVHIDTKGFLPRLLNFLDYHTEDSALGRKAALAIRNLLNGETPLVEVPGYQPGDVPF